MSEFPKAVFTTEKQRKCSEVPRTLQTKGVVNYQRVVADEDELKEALAAGFKTEQIEKAKVEVKKDAPKKKRKRRTKAEIEADKQKEADAEA